MERMWNKGRRLVLCFCASFALTFTSLESFAEPIDAEAQITNHAMASAQRDVASFATQSPLAVHVPAHHAVDSNSTGQSAAPPSLNVPAPALATPNVSSVTAGPGGGKSRGGAFEPSIARKRVPQSPNA